VSQARSAMIRLPDDRPRSSTLAARQSADRLGVSAQMELGAAAAAADAERLALLPLARPAAQRGAFTEGLSSSSSAAGPPVAASA